MPKRESLRDLKEDLTRGRLALGVCDEAVRHRLLREKKLTLASAIEICRAAELIEMRKHDMRDLQRQCMQQPPWAAPGQTHHDRSQNQTPGMREGAACTAADVNFALS